MQNDEPLIRPIMNLDLVIMNTFSLPAERGRDGTRPYRRFHWRLSSCDLFVVLAKVSFPAASTTWQTAPAAPESQSNERMADVR
jgi:hypothetical protein